MSGGRSGAHGDGDGVGIQRHRAIAGRRALPFKVAPVFRVILVGAQEYYRRSEVPVPRVAELPTCQYLLHQCPGSLSTTTDELIAVVRVAPYLKNKDRIGVAQGIEVKCSR